MSETRKAIAALVRKRIETLADDCDPPWPFIWKKEARAIEQVIRNFPDEGKKSK